ncbi:MAG TPA: hypothetical protein H9903_19680, partial [Candidatus Aquabacterium excrementipullorum]|nr:hypothetical protein [Candidatus Aquabacterium excrementipullorum]
MSTLPVSTLQPGMRRLTDFDGARDAASPQDRLRDVRRHAQALRDRMMAEPEVLFYRSFDLIRAPYPTYYAFTGVFAQYGFKFPLVHLLNRLFVVQYLDHEGALRTLMLSPTDHEANRETPFFKRLARGIPPAVNRLVAPQYNTVEGALAQCGITPDQVDYISYDHLHTQDVRRWLGSAGRPGYFPNARLLVHRQEWACTQALLPVQADWYCPQGIAGIPQDKVVCFDGSLSLGPGLALVHTPGHTEGNHSMAARVPDGIRVTSENGVGVDAYEPINSRINAVRRYARATGVEVILNGNTLEGSNDQYISMVLEKTLAGPSANPAYPNCATSSERTPFWAFPGDVA